MIEYLLFVSLKTCLPMCLYICMFEKIYLNIRTQENYIYVWKHVCLEYCIYVCLIIWKLVVQYSILSGWYQQNECLLTLKHVRLDTCLLSCFYASSNFKFLKRINCIQTRLHICLHVCMFVCLHACMPVCLHVCMHVWLCVCVFVLQLRLFLIINSSMFYSVWKFDYLYVCYITLNSI